MYFNNHLGATTENDIVAVFITLYSIGEGAEGYAALLPRTSNRALPKRYRNRERASPVKVVRPSLFDHFASRRSTESRVQSPKVKLVQICTDCSPNLSRRPVNTDRVSILKYLIVESAMHTWNILGNGPSTCAAWLTIPWKDIAISCTPFFFYARVHARKFCLRTQRTEHTPFWPVFGGWKERGKRGWGGINGRNGSRIDRYMVDDFFKITLTIGRIGYIRRRERSIRRDCELFSYREFIIEKNDWRMSEIFIIEIYNSEIGVSRNEDWEYLIRNIVIISLSSVDVELWNRFLKHVDIVVGYRLESIRQTEGETDVIVQSNLEMDKEYQQSSLYFLRVGIFKLQAYTLIFTTYFSYFNTLNFYPHESFTKIEFLYSRDYKSFKRENSELVTKAEPRFPL